jgi:hypothetical protein
MARRGGQWRGGPWRDGALGALAVSVLCCAGASIAAAAQTTPTANPYNDQLMRMSPDVRAAKLAAFLGATCIGTKPFLMGITREGRAKGYAYWSLGCAGGDSYMIQIDPEGGGAAIDCRTLKQNGEGRECYKAF